MFMNWSYWTGQGSDVTTSNVLGCVSIGIDVFKATLPLVLGWAWHQKYRLAFLGGLIFLLGCLGFSLMTAVGYTASSRGLARSGREAASLGYTQVAAELDDTNRKLGALSVVKPLVIASGDLERVEQDRRFAATNGCITIVGEQGRTYCREHASAKLEREKALEEARLQGIARALRQRMELLTRQGARLDQDMQAGVLARVTGFRIDSVQTGTALLIACLIEFGAAFGWYLAVVPLRASGSRRNHPASEVLPAPVPRRRPRPRRIVERDDGGLALE